MKGWNTKDLGIKEKVKENQRKDINENNIVKKADAENLFPNWDKLQSIRLNNAHISVNGRELNIGENMNKEGNFKSSCFLHLVDEMNFKHSSHCQK